MMAPAPRIAALALALAAAGACGRTPAFAGGAGTEGTTGGSSSGTCPGLDCGMTGSTSEGSSTGGDSGSGAIPDLPPPPTCRDALGCILDCLLAGDLACTQGCIGALPPEEAQAMAALLGCVVGVCASNGACDPLNLNQDCFTCIGIRLVAPEPTGCEAEAMACHS